MIAMSQARRFVGGSIAILTLLLLALTSTKAEQLPIRAYTTADGLARDRVYKIVADPRGFLWFCTYDGISRFDGYGFVNYSVADGLPHPVVLIRVTTTSQFLRSGHVAAGLKLSIA